MDLTAAKTLRDEIAGLRGELTKRAFLPMPGDMPQQMQPGQGDPAQMQQGAPPPGAPQGAPPQAPPQDPAAQGAPPQDPAAQGQPPMDPAAQGGQPPGAPQAGNPDMAQVVDQLVQGLEEMFGIVQEMGQGMEQLQAENSQIKQQIDIIVKALDQPAPAPAGMGQPGGQPPMDPMMQAQGGQPADPMQAAMQQQGPPPGAGAMAGGMQPLQ